MKYYYILILAIFAILLIGCNSENIKKPKVDSESILNPPLIKFNKNFTQLLLNYNSLNFTDCGQVIISHFRNNEGNPTNVTNCIIESFKSCKQVKAFYFSDTEDKKRTAAFLSVYPELFGGCKMVNHYISEDIRGYSGEFYMYCHKINTAIPPEYFCLDNGKDVQPVL